MNGNASQHDQQYVAISQNDFLKRTLPKAMDDLHQHGIGSEPFSPQIVRLTEIIPVDLTA